MVVVRGPSVSQRLPAGIAVRDAGDGAEIVIASPAHVTDRRGEARIDVTQASSSPVAEGFAPVRHDHGGQLSTAHRDDGLEKLPRAETVTVSATLRTSVL